MSSHHIVREKQEPALLIMSLQGFDNEHLGQILEWSPTVIVNEDVFDHANSLAFKVDAVVSQNPEFRAQESTLIILTESNPLEDALKYLLGERYPAVNVVTDRFELKDYAMFAQDIDLVIFIGNKKIFPVKSGFSKWKAAGERVHLMHEVNDLDTSGLSEPEASVFETEKDGFYTLTFKQPFIFIAEEL